MTGGRSPHPVRKEKEQKKREPEEVKGRKQVGLKGEINLPLHQGVFEKKEKENERMAVYRRSEKKDISCELRTMPAMKKGKWTRANKRNVY